MLGYPSPNPVIRADQERRIAASTIMKILAEAGRSVEINPGELRIGDRLIYCDTRVRHLLAEAIYGATFPRAADGEFFHNTGVEGFRGIAQSRELRLFTLRRRMGNPFEGELYNLATLEGWRGADVEAEYPEKQRPGTDLFYASLTKAAADAGLWDFGPVRLRLRVDTNGRMGQLRTVQYHAADHVTLLGLINRALAANGHPPILPQTSLRMSALSLPTWLRNETEVRLLHMHLRGQSDDRRNDGEWDYWPVPIGGPSDIADVSLIGIEVNTDEAFQEVQQVLENSPLVSVVPIRVS